MRPMFTPEGTLGPFYPGKFGLTGMSGDLYEVAPGLAHRPRGQPIRISGRLTDANGEPVPGALLEFWQANADGRYRHPMDRSGRALDPQFDGFARILTNDAGEFLFSTIKPGAHPTGDNTFTRAPHLRLTIFASGVDRLITQIFFDDEPSLNAEDPVLNGIPEPDRSRLLACRNPLWPEPAIGDYLFNIVMRGENETPFFDDWER